MPTPTRGHDVGDIVLVEVAQALSESVTQNDVLARVGGEEFVLLIQEDRDSILSSKPVQRV